MDQNIKFTRDWEENASINFLDVKIYKKDKKLLSRIYRKASYTGRYLDFHSNHPNNVKKAIAINLFDRAIKYTQEEEYQIQECQFISKILSINNYPKKLISSALKFAKMKNQQSSQPKKLKSRDSKWIVMLYVTSLAGEIKNKIRHLPLTTSWKPLLTMADLYYSKREILDLESRGVIYVIPCSCGEIYIGETSRNVATRIKEHKRYMSIENKDDPQLRYNSAVANHALQLNHVINWGGAFPITRETDTRLRKIKEAFFIKALKAKINITGGVHVSDDWFYLMFKSFKDILDSVCKKLNGRTRV